MRGREFLDKMELLDPELVQAAAVEPEKPARRQTAWDRLLGRPPAGELVDGGLENAAPRRNIGGWIAAALCLCAALLPVFLTHGASLFGVGSPSEGIKASKYAQYQDWYEGFEPEDYFKFNPAENQGKTGIYLVDGLNSGKISYVADDMQVIDPKDPDQLSFTRAVNNARTAPVRENQYLYAGATFQEDEATEARYLWETFDPDDGEYTWDSIYVVASAEKQSWDRFERYVGSSQSETVTIRDGVPIRATGRAGFEKALWFTKDGFWYKVYGDPDTTAQDLADVMDWIWTGEAGLSGLDKADGDVYTLQEYNKNLEDLISTLPIGEYIPTDPRWCSELTGVFLTNVNGSSLAARCYYGEGSKMINYWKVYMVNDMDPWPEFAREYNLGQLAGISQEQVRSRVIDSQIQVLSFQWGPYYVEAGYGQTGTKEDTAKELWKFIRYLQEEMDRPDGEQFEQAWDESFQPEDLFQHESSGVSSYAVGDYFSLYNSPEAVYLTDFMDGITPGTDGLTLLGELYYALPKSWEFLSSQGSFNKSGELQNLFVTWYLNDTSDIAFPNQSIALACGPGTQDFSALITEGRKSGMTVTDINGTKVYALGGKYEVKLLAFQNETGWYFLQGESGASLDNMAAALKYLLEKPIDFSLFTKEAGCTYDFLDIPAEEMEEKLGSCKLAEMIPKVEEFMPAIQGAVLTQRHGPEGTEDVQLSLSLAARSEPNKFIQDIDIFVDSDIRWLGGVSGEIEAVLPLSDLYGLSSKEEWRKYTQGRCGLAIYRSNMMVLELDGVYAALSLNAEATIDQISEHTMDQIMEVLENVASIEQEKEARVSLMHQTWRKAIEALDYKEPPLGELTLANHPYHDTEPIFDLAFPLSTEEVEDYLQDDLLTYATDNDGIMELAMFQFKWGDFYAYAPITPIRSSTTADEIAAILNRVRNTARPDTMGTIYTMGSSTVMTVNPALRDALPDLFQSTTQLGVPVDWPIPVEDAVNVWLEDFNSGLPIAEQCIHSILIEDVSKDRDAMLANVRYLVKPTPGTDWHSFTDHGIEAGEDGWVSIECPVKLEKRSVKTWKVTGTGAAEALLEDSDSALMSYWETNF